MSRNSLNINMISALPTFEAFKRLSPQPLFSSFLEMQPLDGIADTHFIKKVITDDNAHHLEKAFGLSSSVTQLVNRKLIQMTGNPRVVQQAVRPFEPLAVAIALTYTSAFPKLRMIAMSDPAYAKPFGAASTVYTLLRNYVSSTDMNLPPLQQLERAKVIAWLTLRARNPANRASIDKLLSDRALRFYTSTELEAAQKLVKRSVTGERGDLPLNKDKDVRKSRGYMPKNKHFGMDLFATTGDYGLPIIAPAAGTVTLAKKSATFGNTIIVTRPDGYAYRLAHLSSADVKKGDNVLIGQVLGKVGNSGRVRSSLPKNIKRRGTHLHYEVYSPTGKTIDPESKLGIEKASYLKLSGLTTIPQI